MKRLYIRRVWSRRLALAGVWSRRLALALVLCAASSIVSGSRAAAERKVFLNGIDLADVDVRGHSFDGCTVRFDKHGNVHITVKGLQIGTTEDAKNKPDDKQLGHKYFLIVKPVGKNGEVYQLSVYINGKLFKLVKGMPQMQVHDVTRLVKAGGNEVRLVAARVVADGAKRVPSDDLEVVIGRGAIDDKGTVVIQVPYVQYRRKFGDSEPGDDKHRFTTR